MTSTPTRLSKLAGAAPQAAPASVVSVTPLKRTPAAGRRGEEVHIPILGRVFIELPGARVWQEIEAAIRREMRRLEVGDLSIMTAAAYEVEQALRVLAASVRDPDDHAVMFGTLEEWGELDNDLINLAWHAFGDVRERLDPISIPLTDEEIQAIGSAVKKKDGPTLRSYGIAKLSAYLASTVDPPATSPSPNSQSTDSLSDSSRSPTPS